MHLKKLKGEFTLDFLGHLQSPTIALLGCEDQLHQKDFLFVVKAGGHRGIIFSSPLVNKTVVIIGLLIFDYFFPSKKWLLMLRGHKK